MALIDTAWRVRFMIFVVVSLLLVGDLFGYGAIRPSPADHHSVVRRSAGAAGAGVGAGGAPTGPAAAAASKFQAKNAEIDISEGEFRKLFHPTLAKNMFYSLGDGVAK